MTRMTEDELADFLRTNAREFKEGKLSEFRIAFLDESVPGWREYESEFVDNDIWIASLNVGYRYSHGPSESWLAEQNRLDAAGTLNEKIKRALDSKLPGWRVPHADEPGSSATESSVEESPTPKRQAEHDLAVEFREHLRQYRDGRLPESIIRLYDEKLPNWKDYERELVDNDVWLSEQNVGYTLGDGSSEAWIRAQQLRLEAGSLPSEIEHALDTHIPLWRSQ